MLTAGTELPARPRRVLVTGGSGSGKSTLAARIGILAGLPYQEIDALYHGPQWQPRETFADDVAAFVAGSSWVIEWQYTSVRELLAGRADLIPTGRNASRRPRSRIPHS